MKKVIFIIGFMLLLTFNSNSQSGWVSQLVDNNANLTTVKFLNTQIGWTNSLYNVYKTTNGGNNWFLLYNSSRSLTGLFFINENTGLNAQYVSNYPHPPDSYINRTTDGGFSWINVFFTNSYRNGNFYFFNETLGWSIYGECKTTNGGINWEQINISNGYGTSDLKMNNYYYGYCCGVSKIFKSTNAGNNWSVIYNDNSRLFESIYFIDSLFGCVVGGIGPYPYNTGFISKTTNAGVNWTDVFTFNQKMNHLLFTNSYIGYSITTNKVFKTTNAGLNWTRQVCDTSHTFNSLFFLDTINGWIACDGNILLHTTNGGNVSVRNIGSNIPDKFSLSQNYPNPFNPTTNIKYQIASNSFVTLKVYDILGKEIVILVNEKLQPGEYETTFDGSGLTSGIYFYRLSSGDFSETKKMLLVK